MKIKLFNIRFKDVPQQLKIPTDLQPAKDWLDDYKMSYKTDKDVLDTYIRTWLFECTSLEYDFLILNEQEVINQEQPWCLDVVDHKYAAYDEKTVNITLPDQFVGHITDDYIKMWQPFENDKNQIIGIEQLHMIIYNFTCHYLPVSIEIL